MPVNSCWVQHNLREPPARAGVMGSDRSDDPHPYEKDPEQDKAEQADKDSQKDVRTTAL